MKTKKCENHCPKCNGVEIKWGIWDWTDNESFISAVCQSCNCEFREYRAYKETEWDGVSKMAVLVKINLDVEGQDTTQDAIEAAQNQIRSMDFEELLGVMDYEVEKDNS